MESTVELRQYLKKLRLSPMLATLPERAAYAKGNKLTHLEFLELLLADEVERRGHGALARRLQQANVNHDQILERFDWDAKITLDRDRLNSLIGLEWIECRENVILTGPVGVGKTDLHCQCPGPYRLPPQQGRDRHQGSADVQDPLRRTGGQLTGEGAGQADCAKPPGH